MSFFSFSTVNVSAPRVSDGKVWTGLPRRCRKLIGRFIQVSLCSAISCRSGFFVGPDGGARLDGWVRPPAVDYCGWVDELRLLISGCVAGEEAALLSPFPPEP